MSNWVHQLQTLPTWKKYSQYGEEAYIEYILQNIKSKNKHIVELGAWDGYHFSNSRYFIEKGYTATLIDADNHGNDEVHKAMISRENITELLQELKTPEEFDLLSIDLDGNDYWILKEVLELHTPSVIVAEYNPIFSENESYAITYNSKHVWNNNDYYGFSFLAGKKLGEKYGYTCILQNVSLNMYFVKNSVLAESLGVTENQLVDHIPAITYKVEQYHPKSNRTDWTIII
jgi:hypothetical protein